MVVQLALLGYILKPIFDQDSPWMVLGYACFMTLVAAAEAVSRPNYTYKVRRSGAAFRSSSRLSAVSCSQ